MTANLCSGFRVERVLRWRTTNDRSARMIISLFGGTVVRAGKEAEEARLGEELEAVLRSMPGFISYKEYVADDGEAVGIIRMDSREALDRWVHEGAHGEAQGIADDIYERFWVQSAETYREYTWVDGVRTDGDLTGLFGAPGAASAGDQDEQDGGRDDHGDRAGEGADGRTA
jgi:heme-degrading monooxygenase HmoA